MSKETVEACWQSHSTIRIWRVRRIRTMKIFSLDRPYPWRVAASVFT